MNALDIAIAVSQNPTVKAYDTTLSRLHARMVADYGPNFMDAHEDDSKGFPITHEGVNRWTPAQRDSFNRLYAAATSYRASIRARYLAV